MIEAVLFDMDGVVTQTATAHAAAWKRLFDEFLRGRAEAGREPFRPFDANQEYRELVDGRPRYEGVARFLASRGIALPYGTKSDSPDAETICGLGNRKNRYFREWLGQHAVQAFPDALRLIDTLRAAGVGLAVFSASRNARAALESAGLLGRFDAVVTGDEAAALGLPGKPDPAVLQEAAARLHVSPARAAVVEDATAGIEAAIRGGFGRVVGVDRMGDGEALRRAGAHIVVGNLNELSWSHDQTFTVRTVWNVPLVTEHLEVVRRRASGKTLAVFLDYDGTLTPIVEDYRKALLPEDMRTAIRDLASLCPVAIVSGRDVDVVRGLVGLDTVYYAGSHGFDIRGPRGWSRSLEKGVECLPVLDAAERQLRRQLDGVAGHAVERKRFSIAVHYRQAAPVDVETIESVVDRVLTGHPELGKGHGKKVFRIQPRIDWHKGYAVMWLLEQLGLEPPGVVPVYVGDDITDEDAFRTLAGHGLSLVVRDSEDRPTAADYALAGPDDVRAFLSLLTTIASRQEERDGSRDQSRPA
ncbi:MAG: trehalose-phosphatase, partial [Acidobacteriota bacterium]|nr:trehalose-phosphatase [Acidobacteriota bacterium]